MIEKAVGFSLKSNISHELACEKLGETVNINHPILFSDKQLQKTRKNCTIKHFYFFYPHMWLLGFLCLQKMCCITVPVVIGLNYCSCFFKQVPEWSGQMAITATLEYKMRCFKMAVSPQRPELKWAKCTRAKKIITKSQCAFLCKHNFPL